MDSRINLSVKAILSDRLAVGSHIITIATDRGSEQPLLRSVEKWHKFAKSSNLSAVKCVGKGHKVTGTWR